MARTALILCVVASGLVLTTGIRLGHLGAVYASEQAALASAVTVDAPPAPPPPAAGGRVPRAQKSGAAPTTKEECAEAGYSRSELSTAAEAVEVADSIATGVFAPAADDLGILAVARRRYASTLTRVKSLELRIAKAREAREKAAVNRPGAATSKRRLKRIASMLDQADALAKTLKKAARQVKVARVRALAALKDITNGKSVKLTAEIKELVRDVKLVSTAVSDDEVLPVSGRGFPAPCTPRSIRPPSLCLWIAGQGAAPQAP